MVMNNPELVQQMEHLEKMKDTFKSLGGMLMNGGN